VHLSHYALGLASRPLPKLSLRGNASMTDTTIKTNPLAIAYIVTDTFPGGTAVTPRYSEDHVRLDGGADYALAPLAEDRSRRQARRDPLRSGTGRHVDPKCGKLGSWHDHAHRALSFTLKIGNGLRKASSFDAAALPPEENPLIREYDYAPRDRVFSSLTGAWTATPT
jgi:hypothetical protein